ncbi:hypothetical protein CE91St64_12140 [Faecalicatena contorta]|nr:hypothetical protein CE91St64_12140 [Faecalicatena contorta]
MRKQQMRTGFQKQQRIHGRKKQNNRNEGRNGVEQSMPFLSSNHKVKEADKRNHTIF